MKTNYKIKTGISKKNNGFVIIEINYKDSFFEDKYILEGIVKESKINFSIKKNNKNLNETTFDNDNLNDFFNKLSKTFKDYDLMEDLIKNYKKQLINEVSNFINECNSSMIVEGKMIEGYKDKMRRMSGIKDCNQNIK